jgi:hypothetical protein
VLWQWAGRDLIPFFPATALAWVEQKARWRDVWDGDGQNTRPEAADPWFNLAFGATDPLDDRFFDLAQQVFAPLLAAREG